MKVCRRLLWLLVWCIAVRTAVVAQAHVSEAAQHVLQLKQGVLVVVLPTRHKKIAELERLLSVQALSDKSRRRLERLLEQTRASVASLQAALRDAFRDVYRFSKVAFAYDYEVVRRPLPQLSLTDLQGAPFTPSPDQPVYFAMLGRTDARTGTSMEALLILDARREVLRRPFPYYARRYPPAAILDMLIGAPDAEQRHTRKMVARLNRKLFRYHQDVLRTMRAQAAVH